MTPDAFVDRLRKFGDRSALLSDRGEVSYVELLAAVDRFESELLSRGVSPREIIAIASDFSLEGVALLLAAMRSGAIALLLPTTSAREPVLANAVSARGIYVEIGDGGLRWQGLAAGDAPPATVTESLGPGRGGFAIYTSGSEGSPKAVLHASWRWLSKYERRGKPLRTLAFLLFDHIAGLDTLFYTLGAGGTLVLTRDRSPDGVCAAIERFGVEVLPTSPTFCRLLCLGDAPERFDLSTLRTLAYGSEPMSEATLAALAERLPGVELVQRYGTSELGSPASRSRSGKSTWLSIRPDDLEVDVRDGLLWVRSERAMLGYLNAPQPFDADGWYCTGDRVERDGDWLRILGRDSDWINVGGEKVSPQEVRAVLEELPYVRSARVAGLAHAILGEVVHASLALTEDAPRGAALRRAVRAHCRGTLDPHKVPVKIEAVSDAETLGAKGRRLAPKG